MAAPLTVQERVDLLLGIAEDVQGRDRLADILTEKPAFLAYNGFEPSGRMHIAQALITALNTNVITSAGGRMILLIADVFAWLNHKMDGNLSKIHGVGEYFIEVFRACGMDLDRVTFVWSSEFIANRQCEYFALMNDVAAFATIARIRRTVPIMGRQDNEKLSLSQIIYPCMQTADVFLLGVDVCQLGLDQRKVNSLAIEYEDHVLKKNPPVILSHHMLMGLKGKANKMSKSDPSGAVFIEDSREQVFTKIANADFPPVPEDNPLFEYIKYIILRRLPRVTLCGREFHTAEEIKDDFPWLFAQEAQFKHDVAEYVDQLIQPIRNHFQSTPELQEMLRRVTSHRVTH
jgi:tyrosyl-tRNA synthetase